MNLRKNYWNYIKPNNLNLLIRKMYSKPWKRKKEIKMQTKRKSKILKQILRAKQRREHPKCHSLKRRKKKKRKRMAELMIEFLSAWEHWNNPRNNMHGSWLLIELMMKSLFGKLISIWSLLYQGELLKVKKNTCRLT